jgi:hypothetical protein
MTLIRYGASKVVILQKQPHRVEFAKGYCADHAFENPAYTQGESAEAHSERVSNYVLSNISSLARACKSSSPY